MKEILEQLALYNVWANERLLGFILEQPAEIQTKEVPSSFSSLLKTVVHLWDAEGIWWQRVNLQEQVVAPATGFQGGMKEAAQNLLQQNRLWQKWLSASKAQMLEHVFHYRNSKGQQFRQPVYQMLVHLFNHGTYHRGQLITMLHELGVENLPATDFIVWSRS